MISWQRRFGVEEPTVFAAATSLILLGTAGGLGLGMLFTGESPLRRRRGWGDAAEARRAGLFALSGCVLGELSGRLLVTADLRPTLVTGGTRSGKGRGHVIPSLLSWPESAMIHDPKGELWRITAGWRARFSHTLRFDPRGPGSARWNPLAEIRHGPREG